MSAQALGDNQRVALVAVGGYGRGRLSPHSDIDLLFVWGGKAVPDSSKATLRNLLYPLWDAGFQVGHAVVTAKGAIDRCGDDLHATTSLLSARLVAGSPEPFEELLDRRARWISKHRKSLVRRVSEASAARHATAERAGWNLAPDLKDDIGGLRDLDDLAWLVALTGPCDIPEELVRAGDVLLAAREGLHSEVPRRTDRLRIDLQDRVASRLGFGGEDRADELMEAVHSAARTIEHSSALVAERLLSEVLGGPRRSGSYRDLGDGITLEDGRIRVAPNTPAEPAGALRLLAAQAGTEKPLAVEAFAWLRRAFDRPDLQRWDETTTTAFFELLASPRPAAALELLDHARGWTVLLPEWAAIRGRAQHDPYHDYTVDGHSFVTVAMVNQAVADDPLAAQVATEAGDLRALHLASLIHDIGKGAAEDHSIAGERKARSICARIGLAERTTEEVAALVRHHLLLSDTATRRDLDDGAVIDSVAGTLGDPRLARLLYILSVADGRATGRASWSEWKASLVAELYRRVVVALETGTLPQRSDVNARLLELEAFDPVLATSAGDLLSTLPPSYLASTQVEDIADDLRLLLDPPGRAEVACNIVPGWEPGQMAVTVCVPDRPGVLARTAGVLSLHRVSVLTARAYSTSTGLALERFVVTAPEETDWDGFRDDLASVYAGRLALDARLERKITDYGSPHLSGVHVTVLNDESEHSTVLEVRSPDALGLLYALTSALSDLELDIHVAKIDTLGARVVDVFYVRSLAGAKLDADQAREVERAIQHRVATLLG